MKHLHLHEHFWKQKTFKTNELHHVMLMFSIVTNYFFLDVEYAVNKMGKDLTASVVYLVS